MIYGYARVSTTDQKLDRQLDEFKDFKVDRVFSDKYSGKDFNREEYQKLRMVLQKGDLLVISSIDRLGRDYELITEEWRYLTRELEVDIYVLDMPILDTRVSDNNLTGRLISDIVLQLLSYVAQTEREKTRARQRAGIEAARKRGVHLGKPQYKLPDNFDEVCEKYLNKKITIDEALELTNMKRSTFHKYYQIKYSIPPIKRSGMTKEKQNHYAKKIVLNNMTRKDISNETKIPYGTVCNILSRHKELSQYMKFKKLVLETKKEIKKTKDVEEKKKLREIIKIYEDKHLMFKNKILEQ